MRRVIVTFCGGLTAALFFVPTSTAYAATTSPGDTAVAERVTAVVPSPPAVYTVVGGDSLSAIAKGHGMSASQLATLNEVPDANFIVVGQRLRLNASVPTQQVAPGPPRAPTITASAPAAAPASRPVVAYVAAVATAPPRAAQTASSPSPSGSSSFEQCVIQRESNGDAQVTNPSGHYGLYQFSYSTWVANGGSPADFGHASAGEQHAVFSRSAPSNWSPYDSCTP